MLSRSLSQAQERLSLMRNRRSSGSGTPSLPPPRFSLPPVLSEPRVQPPSSQGSGAQIPQSPQAQGTSHTAAQALLSTLWLCLHNRAVAHHRSPPRNLRARRGVGRKFRRARKHKVRARSRATAHRLSPPLNLQARRGVGRKFRRAHKHKVRAAQQERWRILATSSQPSRNLQARRGVGTASDGAPSQPSSQAAQEPTSARYERAAKRRRIVAAFLATSNLAGEWGASSAEPTSTRYERAAERTAHRRSLPRNLQPRREVGRKFRRAHKRKVRVRAAKRQSPQAQGTSAQCTCSSLCRRIPLRSLTLPHSRISPSSRAPTRRPNLRKEPQSRSLQRMRQNRKSAEMHQSRESQRGS